MVDVRVQARFAFVTSWFVLLYGSAVVLVSVTGSFLSCVAFLLPPVFCFIVGEMCAW